MVQPLSPSDRTPQADDETCWLTGHDLPTAAPAVEGEECAYGLRTPAPKLAAPFPGVLDLGIFKSKLSFLESMVLTH